eukprot:gnl/Ergobibamus_cyprinoides/227.p1 GENE.gnl/Ergobibamus_cyprinoides/227~~gnl/Ergobibamus_cyprinoides/227.p1  ORF type:complete len:469 (-),score=249.22 gnl/Ergobibamus_cyprinoides/227:35-1411(-)
MADPVDPHATFEEDELFDYDEDAPKEVAEPEAAAEGEQAAEVASSSYAGVSGTSFADLLLKPEILKAITENGFEHPSAVQAECIPLAVTGDDILCQAKSGLGKTAVFVLSILQQLDKEEDEGKTVAIVMGHTRELVHQIMKEFRRFTKYLDWVSVDCFYGGVNASIDLKRLKDRTPTIVVATPGRLRDLVCVRKGLDVSAVRYFVLDECDKMLEELDMRATVQDIFMACPTGKQTMMFTATLPPEMRVLCNRWMKAAKEVLIERDEKLTLDGLVQHYVEVEPTHKIALVAQLLEKLEYNQVVIFVSGVDRAKTLSEVLNGLSISNCYIHGRMEQTKRIQVYEDFKRFNSRVLIATELFARGIDIEGVNIVINFDLPKDRDLSRPTTPAGEGAPQISKGSDTYLHRVGRAGRFGTKGLAISFVSTAEDRAMLEEVQAKFSGAKITPMPETIDPALYKAN